jgi:serine/threonine protein kinase
MQTLDEHGLPRALEDEFEIQGTIGRGGMGVVYQALQRRLRRAVALKVFTFVRPTEQELERFRREARVLSRLSHRNVVVLLDANVKSDRPYLAMELLQGETLAARLERGPLSALELRDILLAVLEGLEHVHAQAVFHRDLKPSNIFLPVKTPAGPHRTAVLIDFGIALGFYATRLTGAGMTAGTLRYMAPELVRGEPHSVHSDLFSVGAVAVEAWLGLNLHDDGRPGAVAPVAAIAASLESGVYFDCAISALKNAGPLGQILLRCLHPTRSNRYGRAAEMGLELSRIRASQLASPASAVASSVSRTRRIEPAEIKSSRRWSFLHVGIGMAGVLMCVFLLSSMHIEGKVTAPQTSGSGAPDAGVLLAAFSERAAGPEALSAAEACLERLATTGAASVHREVVRRMAHMVTQARSDEFSRLVHPIEEACAHTRTARFLRWGDSNKHAPALHGVRATVEREQRRWARITTVLLRHGFSPPRELIYRCIFMLKAEAILDPEPHPHDPDNVLAAWRRDFPESWVVPYVEANVVLAAGPVINQVERLRTALQRFERETPLPFRRTDMESLTNWMRLRCELVRQLARTGDRPAAGREAAAALADLPSRQTVGKAYAHWWDRQAREFQTGW